MASTKPIKANYSPKLNGMATAVREFLEGKRTEVEILRTHQGVRDFCYKNTPAFRKAFVKKAGIAQLKTFHCEPDQKALRAFVSRLAKQKGECVFLLKDTFDLLNAYQQKTKKGFGMLINRYFLCETEEEYFALIGLMYQALAESRTQEAFFKRYFVLFQMYLRQHSTFAKKAEEIFTYVATHTRGRTVVFVDIGFQFTFSLVCWAAMRQFGKGKWESEIYHFSTYPWLQEFFKGQYFSPQNETGLQTELEAIAHLQEAMKDRAAGVMVGFAIGDALGFPVAGIDRRDVPRFIPGGTITSFAENRTHPYFSHLRKGQYTDNTKMLILSAKHLIRYDDFKPDAYAATLASWGRGLLRYPDAERWAGPTALNAIKQLIAGKSYRASGSKTTASCSSTYRVIPLALFFRPFGHGHTEALRRMAEISGGITHNSDISRTGAAMVALILADLMQGVLPEAAVRAALAWIPETPSNAPLFRKMRQAVAWSKTKSMTAGRKAFGSGSPIVQTLPMAIFCFLKFQTNFEHAILAAANSFRDDTPAEKKRLKGFSWEEQLLYAKGGNVDGIAGLVGAFMGAHLGLQAIPKKFRRVEDAERLATLGVKLV